MSDTSHVMQAIDVTRHSRITQQLFPSTTALSFVCCFQFACKKSCSWLSVRPSYLERENLETCLCISTLDSVTNTVCTFRFLCQRETACKIYKLQRTPLGIWSSPVLVLFFNHCLYLSSRPLTAGHFSRMYQKSPIVKLRSSPYTCRMHESGILLMFTREREGTACEFRYLQCRLLLAVTFPIMPILPTRMTGWYPP